MRYQVGLYKDSVARTNGFPQGFVAIDGPIEEFGGPRYCVLNTAGFIVTAWCQANGYSRITDCSPWLDHRALPRSTFTSLTTGLSLFAGVLGTRSTKVVE